MKLHNRIIADKLMAHLGWQRTERCWKYRYASIYHNTPHTKATLIGRLSLVHNMSCAKLNALWKEMETTGTLDCLNRMPCFMADTEDCTTACPGYDKEVAK